MDADAELAPNALDMALRLAHDFLPWDSGGAIAELATATPCSQDPVAARPRQMETLNPSGTPERSNPRRKPAAELKRCR